VSEKTYLVEWKSNIVGGSDCTYVSANNAQDAFYKAEPMLNRHKLVPDFLNDYGRFVVTLVE
jgi:hypothetical protein